MKEELIVKYLAGEAESHEIESLKQWRQENKDNEKEFRQMEKIWDSSKRSEEAISFDTEAAWLKVKSASDKKSSRPVISLYQLGLIAASLALIITLSLLFWNKQPEEKFQDLVSNQQISKFQLQDGSELTLSDGHLKCPRVFNGKERKVELEQGTVFLKVAKDASKPFIVEMGDAQITVLGTQFEIQKSKSEIQVKVKEGKVKFSSPYGERILLANQALIYKRVEHAINDQIISDPNTFMYVDSTLYFSQTNLSEVVLKLNQLYKGKSIVIDPQIANCKLSARFEHEQLENVLEVIKASMNVEVVWDQKMKQYSIQGKGCAQ